MLDLPCDMATTATMPADDSFYEGRIEAPGDCDRVRVHLEEGEHYAVSFAFAPGSTAALATLVLRRPDGREAERLRQVYATGLLGLTYTAPATGDYVLELGGTAPAAYRLTVGPDCGETMPTNCSVKVGGSHEGRLQNFYDADVLRVGLQAGVPYDIALRTDAADGPNRLTLICPHGEPIPAATAAAAGSGAGSALRIDGYVHAGCDALDVLRTVHAQLGLEGAQP